MIRSEQRLDALERAVEELVELSRTVPIIVEGKRDVAALRKLGVTGEIIEINTGNAIIQVCDDLAARTNAVVALTDWDRTGGSLMRRLRNNLQGRVVIHDRLRRTFAVYSEVKDVESLASYIATLRKRVEQMTRTPESAPLVSPEAPPAAPEDPDPGAPAAGLP